MYIQGRPVELQTLKHRNPIGRSVTASQPVLSPSSILPSPPSLCALIAEIKIRRAFRKYYFLFITENLRTSGSARACKPHFVTINAGISNRLKYCETNKR